MTVSDTAPRRELTVLGLALGAAITLVFTAANVYLGLKVGLTFASSIPAAVISMAVLRMLRTGSIYENNIVQTVASAAGTLSSVIFVLPGLVMVGWWTGFPYWESFAICAIGGALGVMYTIPLRRALVTNSDLPYPEGVAAAEILRVGAGSREANEEGKAGLIAVIVGSVASAAFAACGRDAIGHRRVRQILSRRRRRDRDRFRSLACAGRRGPPDRAFGWPGDPRRFVYFVGHCDADSHGAASGCRRRSDRRRRACGTRRCA